MESVDVWAVDFSLVVHDVSEAIWSASMSTMNVFAGGRADLASVTASVAQHRRGRARDAGRQNLLDEVGS